MKSKKIVLATQNMGKVKEFEAMLKDNFIDLEVISLLDILDSPDIIEDGNSFRENALIKAKTVVSHTNLITLADDSGLEVDFLDGAPGIHSARFAGEPKSDQRNNQKLLSLLEGIPGEGRTARFRCSICIMKPSGEYFEADGVCEGIIVDEPKGESGFGYDPIFYIPEFKATMAELDPKVKNAISHRSKAFAEATKILFKVFE